MQTWQVSSGLVKPQHSHNNNHKHVTLRNKHIDNRKWMDYNHQLLQYRAGNRVCVCVCSWVTTGFPTGCCDQGLCFHSFKQHTCRQIPAVATLTGRTHFLFPMWKGFDKKNYILFYFFFCISVCMCGVIKMWPTHQLQKNCFEKSKQHKQQTAPSVTTHNPAGSVFVCEESQCFHKFIKLCKNCSSLSLWVRKGAEESEEFGDNEVVYNK